MISRAREAEAADAAGIQAVFSNGDDFVTELTEDKDLVERRIVRIGKTVGATEDGAGELVLEAQAIIAGRLVVLHQRCGAVRGAVTLDESDRRAHADLVWLRGELEHLGLDVRGGSWRMGLTATA